MSIVEQLLRQKAEREKSGKPEAEKPKAPSIEQELHGSGLNQKFLKKQQSQINREEKAAIRHGADKSAIADAERKLHESVDASTEQMLKDFHKGQDIVFDESQEEALNGLLTNQFAVLIGPAGSGKTTLEREWVRRLLEQVPLAEIAGAAFTGRASQQMKRALPEVLHPNISTIHALLEYAPEEVEVEIPDPDRRGQWITVMKKMFRPQRTALNKLRQKVFFFDETGMFGTTLWNEFVAACPREARIILIGDINQLPPVMDKAVLGYAMNKWPVFELKKIHRQEGNSAIIENAHNCLNGRSLVNAKNFHILGTGIAGSPKAPDGQAAMQQWTIQMLAMLSKKGHFDPMRDAFIVPQNKSMIGQEELNPHLMMLFNPPKTVNGVVVNRRIDIHTGTDRKNMAIGDKVMVTSNINTIVPPITNGMIGIVEEININGKYDQKRTQFSEAATNANFDLSDLNEDSLQDIEEDEKEEKDDVSRDQRQASHVMTIKFESGQELKCSTAGDYRRIMHAYAITCHKAQGGEYPNVVIVVHASNHRMLCREWLYTAITRARNNVIILCNNRGMKLALQNQRIKGQTLQDKIKSYQVEARLYDIEDSKLPILWEPEKIMPTEETEQ